MLTYFVYCRKSSEAEDRQILSIDSQVTELKRHAAREGIRIEAILTEAKSAKAPGRPVFNSLMERLYRGEADGVLCWKLDRLARNPVDGGTIIWAMKEHGVKIITPFQTYGQSEDNVVWMYLEFGMAQKYVDDLSKNVKRGLRAKAESGWLPGPTPLGYQNRRNNDGRKTVMRDPKRFDLVRKCWDLMLSGKHTPAEIRNIANTAWGFRTGRGKPMARTTIYNLFSNPFYYGVYEYPKGSDAWHTGRHKPMITKHEFEFVQRQLSRSRKVPKNRKLFALTGLIRCGSCDSAVTAEEKYQLICSACRHKFAHRHKEVCPACKLPIAEMKSPIERHYVYYHCTRSQNPACIERGIERKDLEQQIIQTLASVGLPLLYELWLNRMSARLSKSQEEFDTLAHAKECFPAASPEVQRQIATSILSGISLKDRKVTASLKIPFSFRKSELSGPLNQNTFVDEAVEQHVARA